MESVTSVSGGKSSAYLALMYPTDHYVFAVVLTQDKHATPRDKGLLRECQNRIPWFEGSRELDQTLHNMLRLEQELGKQIDWVASEFTFEDYIHNRTIYPHYRKGSFRLPNRQSRFCTVQLKLHPIFSYCHRKFTEPVLMHVGFRWDEPRRVERWTCDQDKFRYATSCPLVRGRWKYQTKEWRVSRFPLYEDRVTRQDVTEFWEAKGWDFPRVSNCDFCFHHTIAQQQSQHAEHPERSQWWVDLEESSGKTFGDLPLKKILGMPAKTRDYEVEEVCHCTD